MKFLVNFLFVFLCQSVDVVKNSLHAVGSLVNDLSKVNKNEETANDVTVKSVCKPSMTWDTVREVLYFKSSLQARGKKATKWCNQGSEESNDCGMDLSWSQVNFH